MILHAHSRGKRRRLPETGSRKGLERGLRFWMNGRKSETGMPM